MAQGYPYKPLENALEEIRLLSFSQQTSVDSSEVISCTIRTAKLDASDLPAFAAISYCWGDSTRQKDILVDGVTVSVPENAELALRNSHLRSFSLRHWREPEAQQADHQLMVVSLIWIDSVCINQADVTERGQQVTLMGEIYGKASLVLIWLGDDVEQRTAAALESIDLIVKQCRRETSDFTQLLSIIYDASKDGENSYAPTSSRPPSAVDWNALEYFFSPPWFTRLWTLQEVILAKKAFFLRDEHTVDMMLVVVAAKWLTYLKYYEHSWPLIYGQDMCEKIFAYRAHHWLLPEFTFDHPGDCTKLACRALGWSLPALMSLGFHQKCTDPKDRLYANYGLMDSSVTVEYLPDYDLPLVETYKTAVKLYILASEDLSFLYYARGTVRQQDSVAKTSRNIKWHWNNDWSTWVPFWDEPLEEEFQVPARFDYQCYQADKAQAGHRLPLEWRSISGEVSFFAQLSAQGLLVDIAATTSDASAFASPHRPLDEASASFYDAWTQTAGPLKIPSGQSRFEALIRLLLANVIADANDGDRRIMSWLDVMSIDFETVGLALLSHFRSLSYFDKTGLSVARPPEGYRSVVALSTLRLDEEEIEGPVHSPTDLLNANKHEDADSLMNWCGTPQSGRRSPVSDVFTACSDEDVSPETCTSGVERSGNDEALCPELNLGDDRVHERVRRWIATHLKPVHEAIEPWDWDKARSETACPPVWHNENQIGSIQMRRRGAKPWNIPQAITRKIKGRRLFTTRSGYAGLGPEDMEPGDLVCVLFGCRMPVVLREDKQDPGHHHFVGLCYTHGVMDGEFIAELEEKQELEAKTQEFVLV